MMQLGQVFHLFGASALNRQSSGQSFENAGDRIVVFNLLTGRFADNRLAIGLKGNVTLGFELAQSFTNSKSSDLQSGREFSFGQALAWLELARDDGVFQLLKKKLCQ